MVDLIQLVAENSEMILIIISLVFAIVARYFQNQSKAIMEAAQAITELAQTALDAAKDGAISGAELTAIVEKIEAAKKEIQEVIDIFMPKASIVEKFASVFVGYRSDEIYAAQHKVQTMIQGMKKKK